MNLGIDFGSTYTIAATFREDQERLEAIEADSGVRNVNVPSMVSFHIVDDKKELRFGSSAKDQTGEIDFRSFKAFKMLLMETNQKLLGQYGYDDEFTPKQATADFLRYVISKSLEEYSESSVENLVIGAPDVWFNKFDTLGGRTTLRDVCSRINGVNGQNIRIVSEPVLASAYFAYNFKMKKKKAFSGCILIVDYGGGTLDLSLCQVSEGKSGSMEIRMLESNGAGENSDRSVGNAGIVYMESLMEHVIRRQNPDRADAILGTEIFYKAVNDLEKEIVAKTGKIKQTFEDCGIHNIDELQDEKMDDTLIVCGDGKYTITYADLLQVYNEKIRDVFQQKMEQIIDWAETYHSIRLRPKENEGIYLPSSIGDSLKIALVGGFSNFYLVKKQMEDTFGFSSKDERARDIITTGADRERAISYGAGLIAAGIVGIRNTAPYSIGIMSRVEDRESIDYMVQYRADIELDKAYYIEDENGNCKVFSLAQNKLTNFVIDHGRADNVRMIFDAREEFQKKLTGLVKNPFKTCCLGISFGASDVLSLHIREFFVNTYPQRMADKETIIELGQLKTVFEEKNIKEER